jgi:NADPH:quinone reductase
VRSTSLTRRWALIGRRAITRAIVLEKFGELESLVYKEISQPEPTAGQVAIEVKAFGINHAEMHMRRGEWAEAAPVSGIECVGLVKSCPGGEFPVGAKVAALMGGLGERSTAAMPSTRAPPPRTSRLSNPISHGQNWRRSRKPTRPRGRVCFVISKSKGSGAPDSGRAVIVRPGRAQDVGECRSSRDCNNPQSRALLDAGEIGCRAMRDRTPDLSKHIAEAKKFDAILDLVGNSVVLDSLAMLRRGGRSCLAGWLGGLDPIPDFIRCCKWRAVAI